MAIKNILEYENKEQKEIKEKKSEGDDNDWGHNTNCYRFARIVILFFLVCCHFKFKKMNFIYRLFKKQESK